MRIIIDAACGSNKGKVRGNNEDNYCFAGKYLPAVNNGTHHPVLFRTELNDFCAMAIFDGMGGENYGELASYVAAAEMEKMIKNPSSEYISGKAYLTELTNRTNMAVVDKAREMLTSRMGCTLACLYFEGRNAYSCNVGDSRIYRIRDGVFSQLSVDHVSTMNLPENSKKKAPLTQHLGIDPEEMLIQPSICYDEVQDGDRFIICSDGLTDMLTNLEINRILYLYNESDRCVDKLIQAALDNGGRDNVTVIVCNVKVER